MVPVCWLVLSACGPQVEIEGDSGSSSRGEASTGPAATTAGPTTEGPVSVTLTTGPLDPSTSGVDPDESGSGTTSVEIPEDCSTIEQDCPSGYKCMPRGTDGNSWNDTHCVAIVEQPGAPGEPCFYTDFDVLGGEDNCDGTSMCWDVHPESGLGTCTPFCIGTEEEPRCSGRCDACYLFGDGAITLCFPTCDPLLQDCEPGEACYAIENRFECMPDDSPAGTDVGSPCEFITVCPPGMVCLDSSVLSSCDPASAGCCIPFCSVEGADPCPGLAPGSSCVPWYQGDDVPTPGQCHSALPGVCIEE